jgi:hypothetical protein
MKSTTLFLSLLLLACTSKESITPTSTDIVGKWSPTYFTSTKNADGTWEPFQKINTFVALPVYEFTSDGRFLKDGKSGASCCSAGDKYLVENNKITFSQQLACATVCLPCDNWAVIEIKSDTLILEECARVRNKFVRIK